MTIIRWRTQPTLQSIFNQNFHNRQEDNFNEKCGCLPETNIAKTTDRYTIEMAVPGVRKEDFGLHIEKNVLSISYEPTKQAEKEINFLRREFKQDAFTRYFTLPESCEADKISARYTNGILVVEVPFEDPEKTKITKSITVG